MATTSRSHDADLSRRLRTEPWAFDLFQAVRILEREARTRQNDTALQPVGGDARPEREVVRFRTSNSLAFPACEVVDLEHAQRRVEGESSPPVMTVAALGLTGQLGALPAHYSDLVLHRVRSRDTALRDFLDLFNHRSVSFLFRAFAKQHLAASFERAALGMSKDESFTNALRALVGRGTGGRRKRLHTSDEAAVHFAGHFSRRVPSVVRLEAILSAYFEQPVAAEQFCGDWILLGIDERSRLPTAGATRGRHAQLGRDLMLGSRAFDVCGWFRLRVGPMTYAEFREYLPIGKRLRPFCEMVRSYVGHGLRFDVRPVLAAGEAPRCHLGSELPDTPRIGWNTWLGGTSGGDDFAGVTYGLDEL